MVREEMAAGGPRSCTTGRTNLGIGLPTLVPNYVGDDVELVLQSGERDPRGAYPVEAREDPDLINAGKETVTCAGARRSSTPPRRSG